VVVERRESSGIFLEVGTVSGEARGGAPIPPSARLDKLKRWSSKSNSMTRARLRRKLLLECLLVNRET
jgi:hypothetical protein